MSAPLIGITVGPQAEGSPFLQTRATYPRAIEHAGGLPVLVPPLEAATLGDLLPRLDGIVFPGGLDVDPSLYGEAPHALTEVNRDLDRLELGVAQWAIDAEVPTLGICRGQQLLNVALGGSLIQHLDDHRQRGDRAALTQRLDVSRDSRLREILGSVRVEVNTLHHQAVRQVGRGLKAVAWSEDGTIEALESEQHPWLLMVQFHPEELFEFHKPSERLFTAFVAACRARMRSVTTTLG